MKTIPVHETIQQTIQGEGYWVGTSVDFIRLAGCPVACPWCDTGYSNTGIGLPRKIKSFDELIYGLRSPRIVISGGEPFIHPQLPDLIKSILDTGRQVSVETSGAFWKEVSQTAWITLSPKEHINPHYPIRSEMWERANEIKIVISTGLEVDFYASHLINKDKIVIFLQPEWAERDRTLPLVLEILKSFPKYRLSLQAHKYIGVP